MISYLGLLIWILLRFVIVALRCLGLGLFDCEFNCLVGWLRVVVLLF